MSQLCMLTSSYTSSLVMQGLKEMYSSGEFLDLEIFDILGGSVHAHSCVMSAVSPVLKTHLHQTGSNQQIQRLCFRDITVTEWRFILDFVYMGEVVISIDQITRVTDIVKSLEIAELIELCKLTSDQAQLITGSELPSSVQVCETDIHTSVAPIVEPPPAIPQSAPVESQRFPQHSLTPGRGTQCPYTKKGTLGKHRLAPIAHGKITGPYGTVDISSDSLDLSKIMSGINEAFYGKDGEPQQRMKKPKMVKSTEPSVTKIKTEKPDEEAEQVEESEQFVYIAETGELRMLSKMEKVEFMKPDKIEERKRQTPEEEEEEEEAVVQEENEEAVQEDEEEEDDIDTTPSKTMPIKATSLTKSANNTTAAEDKNSMEHDYSQQKSSGATLYKCCKCNIMLPFGPRLRRHEQRHSSGGAADSLEYQCPDCQKYFSSSRSLNFHSRMNCTPFNACDYCSAKFHFRYKLDQHMVEEHPAEAKKKFGDVPHQCTQCDLSFATNSLLNQHKGKAHRRKKRRLLNQSEDNDEPVQCDTCDKQFAQDVTLKRHIRFNHVAVPCLYCKDTMMPNRRALLEHLGSCGRAPTNAQQLYMKRTGLTKRAERSLNCPHCQAPFHNKADLLKHNEAKHGGLDLTYCQTCQKRFPTIRAFRLHMMRHFGIRPHQCPACEKKFVELGDLQKHILARHSNERRYSCPHCNWMFKDNSNLHSHCRRKHGIQLPKMRYHANSELPEVKKMTDQQLASALIVECGGKSWSDATQCVLCGLKFLQRGNLYLHARKRHNKDFKQIFHDEVKRRKMPLSVKKRKRAEVDLDDELEIEEQAVRDAEDQEEQTIIEEVEDDGQHTITLDDNEIEAVEIMYVSSMNRAKDSAIIGTAVGLQESGLVSSEQRIAGDVPVKLEKDEGELGGGKVIGEISHEDLLQAVGYGIGDRTRVNCPICRQQFEAGAPLMQHGRKDHAIDFQKLVDEWVQA